MLATTWGVGKIVYLKAAYGEVFGEGGGTLWPVVLVIPLIFLQHAKKITLIRLWTQPKAEEILFTFSVFSCMEELSELYAM